MRHSNNERAKPNKIIKNLWQANFIYRNSNLKLEIQITHVFVGPERSRVGSNTSSAACDAIQCSLARCKRLFCYQITHAHSHTHTHGEPLIHTHWQWADFYAHSCSAAVLLRIRPVGHVSQSSLRPGRQKMFAIIAYTNEAHVSKPNRAGHWWSDRATEEKESESESGKGRKHIWYPARAVGATRPPSCSAPLLPCALDTHDFCLLEILIRLNYCIWPCPVCPSSW